MIAALAAAAAVINKIGPWLEAAKAYQAARKQLIDEHGQGVAEQLPNLSAVIDEAHRRLAAWDDDIDRREARIQVKADAEAAAAAAGGTVP